MPRGVALNEMGPGGRQHGRGRGRLRRQRPFLPVRRQLHARRPTGCTATGAAACSITPAARPGVTSIGLNFVGFGAAFLDYDNDGAEDLLIVNGHVLRHPPSPQTLAQRPVLFHNLGPAGPAVSARPLRGRFGQGGAVLPRQAPGPRPGGRRPGQRRQGGRGRQPLRRAGGRCCGTRWTTATTGWGWSCSGDPYRDAVGARLTLEVGGRRLVRAVKGGRQLSAPPATGAWCSAWAAMPRWIG